MSRQGRSVTVGIKKVLVVSDLHAGSKASIVPPDFEPEGGGSFVPNESQLLLYEAYHEMLAWIAEETNDYKDSFVFVHNGDAIDGIHHGTVDIISHDWQVHVDLAAHLLKPIADRAHKTFIIEGTETHTKDFERSLGQRLGGVRSAYHRAYAWPNLTLNVNGCNVRFSHHVGPTNNSANRPKKVLDHLKHVRSEITDAPWRDVEPPPLPSFVCGAHCHTTTEAFINGRHLGGITTGSWQVLNRYGQRVVNGAQPIVGVAMLDWTNRGYGENPDVHWFTRVIEQPEAELV